MDTLAMLCDHFPENHFVGVELFRIPPSRADTQSDPNICDELTTV